jgi:hypothetical protein
VRYRPDKGGAETDNCDGAIPPASRNHLLPTGAEAPTWTAASSLERPVAIKRQNKTRWCRWAAFGRPGERNFSRPALSEPLFRIVIVISCVRSLRRPIESANDILIAVVDGLKGFPEAINAVFPDTIVQTCIVHLIRHSMGFAAWKDRKDVAKALKAVYRAKDADAAAIALDEFEAGPWGEKYPAIGPAWRRNWDLIIPFFAFPEGVRRIIYTTNAIEALNSKLRRAVRARGHFPNDDAASKLLYLVLNQTSNGWKSPPREWFMAKTQFAVMFGERFVAQ